MKVVAKMYFIFSMKIMLILFIQGAKYVNISNAKSTLKNAFEPSLSTRTEQVNVVKIWIFLLLSFNTYLHEIACNH